jgi:hypothetical protein
MTLDCVWAQFECKVVGLGFVNRSEGAEEAVSRAVCRIDMHRELGTCREGPQRLWKALWGKGGKPRCARGRHVAT